MKKKKGVGQLDVDLEVDSPAHSFLRPVTPGNYGWDGEIW